jgi:hypothetical protein
MAARREGRIFKGDPIVLGPAMTGEEFATFVAAMPLEDQRSPRSFAGCRKTVGHEAPAQTAQEARPATADDAPPTVEAVARAKPRS